MWMLDSWNHNASGHSCRGHIGIKINRNCWTHKDSHWESVNLPETKSCGLTGWRVETKENGDPALSVKQRPNHGNPDKEERWEGGHSPHLSSCVLWSKEEKGKEQSKLSDHKASSRAAVCIFHVKWKATKMPSRMWGIFLFTVFQARSFWLKEKKKERKEKTEQTSK